MFIFLVSHTVFNLISIGCGRQEKTNCRLAICNLHASIGCIWWKLHTLFKVILSIFVIGELRVTTTCWYEFNSYDSFRPHSGTPNITKNKVNEYFERKMELISKLCNERGTKPRKFSWNTKIIWILFRFLCVLLLL